MLTELETALQPYKESCEVLKEAKWVKREQLHITVLFLGNVLEDKIPKLQEVLRKSLSTQEPFKLRFDKIAFGPTVSHPHLIWGEFQKSSHFSELVMHLMRVLQEASIVFRDEREARPHVTVARFDHFHGKDVFEFKETNIKPFQLADIHLMESVLSHEGAKHTQLAFFPLGRSFSFSEHTADVRMHIQAKTLADLFVTALEGMGSLLTASAIKERASPLQKISIQAKDATYLLLYFLSEVLTLSHVHHSVFLHVEFDLLSDTELSGTLFGYKLDQFEKDVKAVT